MTPQQFDSLRKYELSRRRAFKPSRPIVSKRAMKRLGTKPQGRQMVPLEQLFIERR